MREKATRFHRTALARNDKRVPDDRLITRFPKPLHKAIWANELAQDLRENNSWELVVPG
jgi:hypothetical protein